MIQSIDIIGAGPAGSAAAIAAVEGCTVQLFEKSRLPRHKVCGEFLSPEVAGVLKSVGVWDDFERLGPASIRRFSLHAGKRSKHATLPDCAYGLSRYEFDRLLLEKAVALGAVLVRERVGRVPGDRRRVLACGRRSVAAPGNRLFGLKAHFRGPTDDSVELFFFEGCYVGVSCVERSITNVCGIAPETVLRSHGFDMDAVLGRSRPLADRVRPLVRTMPWLVTGPLVFSGPGADEAGRSVYPAGDALGFTDPFAGTGILNALLTGRLAGIAAAHAFSSERYFADCRHALSRAFRVHSLVRGTIAAGWAEFLMPLVPASWLFRLTRPALL
ncbi:MAG: hypothetical protein M1541_03945 [Acidobacteria bacterium]|nr:hypothetical protein [Acidobacteriota bacterium]